VFVNDQLGLLVVGLVETEGTSNCDASMLSSYFLRNYHGFYVENSSSTRKRRSVAAVGKWMNQWYSIETKA